MFLKVGALMYRIEYIIAKGRGKPIQHFIQHVG